MTKLDISFEVDGKIIDAVDIKPVTFVQFADYITSAQAMKEPTTFEGRLRRIRMQNQVNYLSNGKLLTLQMNELLKMPLKAARKIQANLDKDEGASGKIIREGDGISTAIGYELGTPIAIQGQDPITELEFLAKTYGDVEDVLAAADYMSQTIALLRTVAKPVHKSLTSLPSWAVDRISISDGVDIAQNVTTRFLEIEQEDSSSN